MRYSNYSVGDFAIVSAIKTGHITIDLETGEIRNARGYIMQGSTQALGYKQISLPHPFTETERVFVYVHRAVYIAKCLKNKEPVPTRNYQIDHINGIKTDNRAENLRAVTAKENARNPNTVCTGAKNPNTKITEEQKVRICELRKEGHSNREIVNILQLPVCHQRVSQIYRDYIQRETRCKL